MEFRQSAKVVILLSLILFLAAFLYNHVLVSLLAAALLLFLVYAKQSFQPQLGSLTAQRTIEKGTKFVNKPFYVRTKLRYAGGGGELLVEESIPHHCTVKGDHTVHAEVAPGEDVIIDYHVVPEQRGTHQFNGVAVTVRDRWRLFQAKRTIEAADQVVVHADLEEIKRAERARNIDTTIFSSFSSYGLTSSEEFEGVREYQVGDRLRDIEWKASARLQTLMTKMFRGTEKGDCLVFFDCSRSMRRSSGGTSQIEHAVTFILQLAKILTVAHHRVGLLAFNEYRVIKRLSPTLHYARLFYLISQIPDQIASGEYQAATQEAPLKAVERPEAPEARAFLSTVFPFLVGHKRRINKAVQASGVYEAVRRASVEKSTGHAVVVTDMETNPHAVYQSLRLLARRHQVWLLTPSTPLYHLSGEVVSAERIEKAYTQYRQKRRMLGNIKKMGIKVLSLEPWTAGMDVLRRHKK